MTGTRHACTGIVTLLLVSTAAFAATASSRPAREEPAVRTWAAQFIAGPKRPSRAEAIEDARHFDLLIAHPAAYRRHAAEMKRENPRLRLFVYLNGTFTWERGLPEHWYAHDRRGRRIHPHRWRFTSLLDPRSPAVAEYQIRRARELLATSGYDGLYIDVLGTSPLSRGYVSAPPVNPATRRHWEADDWLEATVALGARITDAVRPRPVLVNGLGSGARYFAPGAPSSQILSTGTTGAVAESWLRDPRASLAWYPSEAAWRQDVDMLVDGGRRRVSMLVMTKLWGPGSDTERAAWSLFVVASYLLGQNASSHLSILPDDQDSTAPVQSRAADLGQPQGTYRKRGVYIRTFERGVVLVNPTKATETVRFARAYRHVGGGPMVRSLRLGPHDAAILVSSPARP